MADREKVIKGLEQFKADFKPFCGNGADWRRVDDAITMLRKEQEAKPVDLYGKDDWYGLVCVCPDCKAEWMGDESNTHFCPNCGRAVKWDG